MKLAGPKPWLTSKPPILTPSRSLPPPQEVKLADQPRIRALFERATSLSLPAKKMKFLFKRWLEYEKGAGDAAAVEHVKKRAMEFVESTLG